MYFHSISSLIIFLPTVFICYPLFKKYNKNLANTFLLAFSLIFYAFDIPWFVLPLLFSAICDYFISKILIEKKEQHIIKKNILLIISIFVNIGLLMTFKYSELITETLSISNIIPIESNNQSIMLPAGISFYTFQTLSFSIDSYKSKIKAMPSFFNYLLFVSYFPQLVAGPILRPSDFFYKNGNLILEDNSYDFNNGFKRICYGLFLKLCLADELARFNDLAFQADFNTLGLIDAWTMAFGFGLQIYFDFSAYSHMAIGISKIIGLPIRENFNFPYSSKSVTNFWKRWHISLSSWVSDYLYSFLNKKLSLILFGVFPLLITWTIMGIWHGASWRYAIWGLINGILILIHRIYKNIKFNNIDFLFKKHFNYILTLFSIMSSWIYFRSNSWDQANYLFINLFRVDKLDLGLRENYYLIVFILTSITLLVGYLNEIKILNSFLKIKYIDILISSFALTFSIIFLNSQSSFIYFQF